MARPTTTPTWATGLLASVIPPSASKIAQGWIQNEKPPAAYLNWILYWMCQWIAYFATAEIVLKLELDGELPSTFTNGGSIFLADGGTITGLDVIAEKNGSGGGYLEIDLVAGAVGGALSSVLSSKARIPGNGGSWGHAGVTASSQAPVINPASATLAANSIVSVNITSGANQPPTTAPESVTVMIRYRRA